MKEYKVVPTTLKKMEAMMNEMAREGWEVVTVTYYSSFTTDLVVTFEKEKY